MSNQITEARDNFIDNLQSMATGSYLRDEDKEFWEAPYPEYVVGEAREILDSLIDATTHVSRVDAEGMKQAAAQAGMTVGEGAGEGEDAKSVETIATIAAVQEPMTKLLALSNQHGGALLEDEEIEDLNAVLRAVSTQTGADADAVIAHVQGLIDNEGS